VIWGRLGDWIVADGWLIDVAGCAGARTRRDARPRQAVDIKPQGC
jgi:hypothetical protein